jgi:hypothetical protein
VKSVDCRWEMIVAAAICRHRRTFPLGEFFRELGRGCSPRLARPSVTTVYGRDPRCSPAGRIALRTDQITNCSAPPAHLALDILAGSIVERP